MTVPLTTTATASDIQLLIKATDFAARKHRLQKRKDSGHAHTQTPYINHPVGVAHILSHEGGITDTNVLITALLHDTVEDTECSIAEIEAEFGAVIAGYVGEVTDDKLLPSAQCKLLQIEHAPHISMQAKLVKLADKLYNLRDIIRCTPHGWTSKRCREYFQWSEKVVDGLEGANAPIEETLHTLIDGYLAKNK